MGSLWCYLWFDNEWKKKKTEARTQKLHQKTDWTVTECKEIDGEQIKVVKDVCVHNETNSARQDFHLNLMRLRGMAGEFILPRWRKIHSPSCCYFSISFSSSPTQCWFNKFYCFSLNLKFIDSVRAVSLSLPSFVLRKYISSLLRLLAFGFVVRLKMLQNNKKTNEQKKSELNVNGKLRALKKRKKKKLEIIKNEHWPNGSKQRKKHKMCSFDGEFSERGSNARAAYSSRLSPQQRPQPNRFHNWWAIKSCSPYLKTEMAISASSAFYITFYAVERVMLSFHDNHVFHDSPFLTPTINVSQVYSIYIFLVWFRWRASSSSEICKLLNLFHDTISFAVIGEPQTNSEAPTLQLLWKCNFNYNANNC